MFTHMIHNRQDLETNQMPNNRMNNKTVIYRYTMEYNLAMRKGEIMQFATIQMEWMGIVQNEMNQKEKDKITE